jgi:hypothetical protein
VAPRVRSLGRSGDDGVTRRRSVTLVVGAHVLPLARAPSLASPSARRPPPPQALMPKPYPSSVGTVKLLRGVVGADLGE